MRSRSWMICRTASRSQRDGRSPGAQGRRSFAAKAWFMNLLRLLMQMIIMVKEPFVKLHDYLIQDHPVRDGVQPVCMAGFRLGNTLSDNGGVTRGVCVMDGQNHLIGIHETSNIVKTAEGAAVEGEQGLTPLDADSRVSMNMWGLQPEFIDLLEKGFGSFLSEMEPGDLKKEYLLPIFIDGLLQSGRAQVKVLETQENWFGVTYQEDKEAVVRAFQRLIAEGVYSRNLYE